MKKMLVALFAMLFLLGMATSAFAATTLDGGIPQAGDYQGDNPYVDPMPDGDTEDNNIGNANETGKGVSTDDGTTSADVIKSDNMTVIGNTTAGTQKTHGEYRNNTNSCASCHQTHTGAAKDLLFKSGVYNTCAACHDGTLGFYNVFEASTAGTFGGTEAGNASVHMVQGTLNIAWAPGGDDSKAGDAVAGETAWTQPFDCAACHAPHGSYSDRLLHYSPNGMANVAIAEGGQKQVAVNAVYALPTATETSPAYLVVKTTAGAVGITEEDAATPVVVAYEKVNSYGALSYKRDKTPWLYGYEFNPYPNKVYYTAFKTAGGSIVDLTIKYGKAYAKGTQAAIDSVATADLARVYVVKLQNTTFPMEVITDLGYTKITKVNPDIYDETGFGVAIGKYCGACHTDYRAGSGELTGMFSSAYRHTTNNDRYTCLKCHFAHGTDVTVMMDAQDNTVASLVAGGMLEADAKNYIVDKNPSSALKRYTNMAVCWKCHTDSKASQLKNNEFYWANYDTVPHGGASGLVTGTQNKW